MANFTLNRIGTTKGQLLAIKMVVSILRPQRPSTHSFPPEFKMKFPTVSTNSPSAVLRFSPPYQIIRCLLPLLLNLLCSLGLTVRQHSFLIQKDYIACLLIQEAITSNFLISFTRPPQIPRKVTLSILQKLIHSFAMI